MYPAVYCGLVTVQSILLVGQVGYITGVKILLEIFNCTDADSAGKLYFGGLTCIYVF